MYKYFKKILDVDLNHFLLFRGLLMVPRLSDLVDRYCITPGVRRYFISFSQLFFNRPHHIAQMSELFSC